MAVGTMRMLHCRCFFGFIFERVGNPLLFEIFKRLLHKVTLAVIHKVVQMSCYNILAPFCNALMHDALFVIRICLTGLDLHGACRTVADAGSKSIAKKVADKAGFAVNHLQGSLGTTRNAVAASGTSFLIYGDNLSFHFRLLLLFLFYFYFK